MVSKHQCPIRFESHHDVKTSVTNQVGESSWCQNISVQADWRVIMMSKHQCPIRLESHHDVKTSMLNEIGESS